MSHDPAAAPDPLRHPSRVLVYEDAEAGAVLAGAIGAPGGHDCEVESAATPAALEAALGRGPWDAVVLDLSAAGAAARLAGTAAAALLGLCDGSAGDAPRPAVMVVRPARSRGDLIPGLPVDLDLAPSRSGASQAALQLGAVLAARKLERALAENDRLRDTVLFARQTAHDLAQPLTTIIARAQLLRLHLKPDDPHARPVGIICEEADRLAKLVQEFQKLKVMSRPAGAATAEPARG